MTIKQILDYIENILKPERHDLQNRMLLFNLKQVTEACFFLQQIRTVYIDSNYFNSTLCDTLIRDLFIHGLKDDAAKRIIFQQNFSFGSTRFWTITLLVSLQ